MMPARTEAYVVHFEMMAFSDDTTPLQRFTGDDFAPTLGLRLRLPDRNRTPRPSR